MSKIKLMVSEPEPEDTRRVLYRFTIAAGKLGVEFVRRIEDTETPDGVVTNEIVGCGGGSLSTYGWTTADEWESLL